jgi:hypothetical protein
MPPNPSVGPVEQCALEKLDRYTEYVSLMGQISNIIVALELYRKERSTARVKAYADTFLSAVEGDKRIRALKALLESSDRIKLPADFDERMPAVIEALRGIRKGDKVREEVASNVKAFLTTFEDSLISLVEEQEGIYFEPWHFGERM